MLIIRTSKRDIMFRLAEVCYLWVESVELGYNGFTYQSLVKSSSAYFSGSNNIVFLWHIKRELSHPTYPICVFVYWATNCNLTLFIISFDMILEPHKKQKTLRGKSQRWFFIYTFIRSNGVLK